MEVEVEEFLCVPERAVVDRLECADDDELRDEGVPVGGGVAVSPFLRERRETEWRRSPRRGRDLEYSLDGGDGDDVRLLAIMLTVVLTFSVGVSLGMVVVFR